MVYDARHGLKDVIATVFAGAARRRCRTRFMTNPPIRVPKRAQPGVATIYQQLTSEEAHVQLGRVVDQLRAPFPQVAAMLEHSGPDFLAFPAFPVSHCPELVQRCAPTTCWSA